MQDHTEALDRLMTKFGSLRAKRNTLLSQRQVISVLDTELSSIELQLSFLSGQKHSSGFIQQHLKIQSNIDQTAKKWFY